MERNSAKQTVPQPSASRKKQQKKTNAAGKHTGRPSRLPMDAYEAWRKSRVLYGGKRLKSGITRYQLMRHRPMATQPMRYTSQTNGHLEIQATILMNPQSLPTLSSQAFRYITHAMRHLYFSTSKTYPSR